MKEIKMNNNAPIELFTDGSAKPNPGNGGLAYIIKYFNETGEEKTLQYSMGFRVTTNNRMEILAAIEGINEILKLMESQTIPDNKIIILYSDSKYLCDAITQGWWIKWQQNNWMTAGYKDKQPQLVKNRDLWERVIVIIKTLGDKTINLVVNHIPGHQGNVYNELADKLAIEAAGNNQAYLIDEGYESSQQYH
jgi:ribonuclease HI